MNLYNSRGLQFKKDSDGVFVSPDMANFDYSDGEDVESYLENAFRVTKDLSTESVELESCSRDWPTEYHLTRKRAQLLKAFDFQRNSRVLEVGCGCGAITRALGEKFEQVVSIEGSYKRAKLARLRCRDLDTVSVICSPYQDIQFNAEFDYVFCIGVLEYAGYFVGGEDPYEAVLRSFARALRPGGVLVLAIENQFGLKYFTSSSEDHTNRMFEGIEGYPRYKKVVRTFGREEIKRRISVAFKKSSFYYPYPDYKIPDAVFSENFLLSADPWELIGGLKSRDYSVARSELFNESLAYREIARNAQLPFFSNSFLIFCGDKDLPSFPNNCEGIFYSSGRVLNASTITRFERNPHPSEAISFNVIKSLRNPSLQPYDRDGFLWQPTTDPWLTGESLQHKLIRLVLEKGSDWDCVLPLLKLWKERLEAECLQADDTDLILGRFVDATWKNCVIDKDEVRFFDQEWSRSKPVTLQYLFIRSAFIFFDDLSKIREGRVLLRYTSGRKLITRLAKGIDLKLSSSDFNVWLQTESQFLGGIAHNFGLRQKVGMAVSVRSFLGAELLRIFVRKVGSQKMFARRVYRFFIRRLKLR